MAACYRQIVDTKPWAIWSWIGRLNAKSKSQKAELRTLRCYYMTDEKKSLTLCPCDYLGWPIWCNVWKNCAPTCERARSKQKTLHYVPFLVNTTTPKTVLTDDAPYKSAVPYMGCGRLYFLAVMLTGYVSPKGTWLHMRHGEACLVGLSRW